MAAVGVVQDGRAPAELAVAVIVAEIGQVAAQQPLAAALQTPCRRIQRRVVLDKRSPCRNLSRTIAIDFAS